MPRKLVIGPLVTVLVATGIAMAAERTAPALPPTPAQLIRARQVSYEMSVITFSQLKRAAEAGSDVTKHKFAADALAQWAAVLPTLYPEGTGPGQTSVESHALAEVWSNRAGFLARANNYSVATSRLVELAKSGDAAGFASQLAVVKKACDSCHADFKTRD
jgi:cytochrome c556